MTSLLLQILFQIGNLLQAKCSTSFVPQTVIRFQGRSPYWASSLDLGKKHSVYVVGADIDHMLMCIYEGLNCIIG